jgi:hypothetical protein
MSPAKRVDRMEMTLRQADAALEKWFRLARKRSAGALRHQVDSLQAGLKKLSAGLEQVEREPKAATRRRATRPSIARKPAPARKRKKAA